MAFYVSNILNMVENRMMKEGGIRDRDTLLSKVAWKVIYFLDFLITLSVIPIISRGTRCVYETQMPPRVTNSIDSHAYIKAFEK
jgi:hypothetical protein